MTYMMIAIAKDLDYFEVTIDEILEEKNNLTQQLEEEKVAIVAYIIWTSCLIFLLGKVSATLG